MRLLTTFSLLGLLCFTVMPCYAQDGQNNDAAVIPAAGGDGSADNVKFPYLGQIVGTKVNIRSGPTLNHYRCGKLNAPANVIVTGRESLWLKVLPPAGSFSWIFAQYVKVDTNTLNVGVVTTEAYVYAGSDFVDPMHSDSKQTKLKIGSRVKLIGKEQGGYYKIKPPEGAHLWVDGTYVKFIRSTEKNEQLPTDGLMPIARPKMADAEADAGADVYVDTDKTEVKTTTEAPQPPKVEPAPTPMESKRLTEYRALAAQVEVEHTKPLGKQNYEEVKKSLEKIAADAEAGKAAHYAKYLFERIKRYELAAEADSALNSLDAKLKGAYEQIESARQQKLSSISNKGDFAVIGQFAASTIYESETGPKRYLVLDQKANVICYAEPVGMAVELDLTGYVDKQVGLIGQILADKESSLALVRFVQVVTME